MKTTYLSRSTNHLLKTSLRLACLLLIGLLVACGDSKDKIKDVVDVADGVPRRTIDVTRMGVNAFANQGFAGSICDQYLEIRDVLGIRYVRVLFAWLDSVQPSPSASPNFSFYDEVLACIPNGMDALVILTNVPSWMSDSGNWIDGNPRKTFVEQWVRPVAERYKGNGKIVAFQVWNEPDNGGFPENAVLDVLTSPENFVELVAMASSAIKEIDSGRLVVNGSTTGIAQNFPHNLDYNRAMRDAGIESFVDFYGIHYYGMSFERFVLEVRDFLNSLSRPIWVTESGITGVNRQLSYVEQVWPFLRENVPGIDRIYYYRFAEDAPGESSFGLRTSDPAAPVSDLYIHLQERAAGG